MSLRVSPHLRCAMPSPTLLKPLVIKSKIDIYPVPNYFRPTPVKKKKKKKIPVHNCGNSEMHRNINNKQKEICHPFFPLTKRQKQFTVNLETINRIFRI